MGPITAFVQIMFAVIRRSLSSSLVSDIVHSKNQSSVSVTSYMHGSCSAVRVVACVAFVDISHDNAFTCVLKSTLLNACVSLRFATFEQLVRIHLLWALRSRTTRLDHEVNVRSLFFLKNRTAVLNNLKITRKPPGLCSRDPYKSQTDPNSPQIN